MYDGRSVSDHTAADIGAFQIGALDIRQTVFSFPNLIFLRIVYSLFSLDGHRKRSYFFKEIHKSSRIFVTLSAISIKKRGSWRKD